MGLACPWTAACRRMGECEGQRLRPLRRHAGALRTFAPPHAWLAGSSGQIQHRRRGAVASRHCAEELVSLGTLESIMQPLVKSLCVRSVRMKLEHA